MSTDYADLERPPRWPGVLFIALLVLAVFWPAPVVWLNQVTIDQPIAVSYESFLGREAPAWDLVFWGIVGLYALLLMHGRLDNFRTGSALLVTDLQRISAKLRRKRETFPWKLAAVWFLVGAAVVFITWIYFDATLVGLAEAMQTDTSRAIVRILNRLGGGMNPPLIVAYFMLVGILFSRPRLAELAICMVLAGGVSGILVQILKQLIGRSRPELWLGPFHHTWPSATSFPSGHTVGACALASVIVFGARETWLRVVAAVLAIGVAASRVFAFRHWPSDVIASALLGTVMGWFFVSALIHAEEPDNGG